jgi:Protein of unknown function (DUF3089)
MPGITLALALATAACSSGGGSVGGSSATAAPTKAAAAPVWLCQPGTAGDPCAYRLAATAVAADGAQRSAAMPGSKLASRFDCFYVYPTLSGAQTGNTAATVTKAEIGVAVDQAAPFSGVCSVWAPSYRSQTWTAVEKGLAGDESEMRSTFSVAYDSVLSAWQSFLAHDDNGKPIVLIGDSQGSAILIHLISTELDHEPSVRARLLVAILVGGNLQVPAGKTVGATFTKVPLCASSAETGCAIAFSSYPSQPPADSIFGRPGQGVSLQSGQTAKAGQQIACVNPAALAGGSSDLDPFLLAVTQTGLKNPPATPWVTYPDLYSAGCKQGGGATWLQITSLAGTGDTRPVVSDDAGIPGSGPTWGYHDYEYGLTLGSLLRDVAGEESAWEAHR